jgi:hypothetical protein
MTGKPSGLAPRVAGVARHREGLGTPALAGLATFVAVLGGPGVPAALGQDEFLATWLWDVTTQNGDAIVEPGETATITLSIDFTPNVGEPGKTGKIIDHTGNFGVFFISDDPITAISFDWQPVAYEMREVSYDTHTAQMFVSEDWIGVEWGFTETTIAFQVVPAPAGTLLCVGWLIIMRRFGRKGREFRGG